MYTYIHTHALQTTNTYKYVEDREGQARTSLCKHAPALMYLCRYVLILYVHNISRWKATSVAGSWASDRYIVQQMNDEHRETEEVINK